MQYVLDWIQYMPMEKCHSFTETLKMCLSLFLSLLLGPVKEMMREDLWHLANLSAAPEVLRVPVDVIGAQWASLGSDSGDWASGSIDICPRMNRVERNQEWVWHIHTVIEDEWRRHQLFGKNKSSAKTRHTVWHSLFYLSLSPSLYHFHLQLRSNPAHRFPVFSICCTGQIKSHSCHWCCLHWSPQGKLTWLSATEEMLSLFRWCFRVVINLEFNHLIICCSFDLMLRFRCN